MSEHVHEPHWEPGDSYPDPGADTGPTRWAAPVVDYAIRPDGTAPWADVPAPAAVPPVIAEGPQQRPGWLTAGRPDDAA